MNQCGPVQVVRQQKDYRAQIKWKGVGVEWDEGRQKRTMSEAVDGYGGAGSESGIIASRERE